MIRDADERTTVGGGVDDREREHQDNDKVEWMRATERAVVNLL